jgi:hypothetical protein
MCPGVTAAFTGGQDPEDGEPHWTCHLNAELPPAARSGAAEVGALDTSLEDLLTRVHEFVGVLDMARGD